MDVRQSRDVTQLRLEAKPGVRLDTSQIAAGLDHASARLAESDLAELYVRA